MAFLIQRKIKPDKPVLYNNYGVKSLQPGNFFPEDVSTVGGWKYLPCGSFVKELPGRRHRALTRAAIISPYAGGATQVIVNMPSVFKPGDVIYSISQPGTSPRLELQNIRNATTPLLGTVVSVDPANRNQITTVTPALVAVGNTFTLTIQGVPVSFVATAASVANVTAGLKAVFDSFRSGISVLEGVTVVDNNTNLTITTVDSGEIFTTIPTATAPSTLTLQITQPVGTLTIVPQAGGTNLPILSKIGTINDVIVGVLDRTQYLTDPLTAQDHMRNFAPYNAGMLFTQSLPYLDADILDQLKDISCNPPYGV